VAGSKIMVQECFRLLGEAEQQSILLRAIGGVAICIRSPSASQLPCLRREYGDLDFVTTGRYARRLRGFFESLGYEPNLRFNAIQGKTRMMFYAPGDSWQVDVFVDVFKMCHVLRFQEGRLRGESHTIPLAELLLTKLQVVQLNEKDIQDVSALLLEHSMGDRDGETVNADWIASLLSDDWGFFTTATRNAKRILVQLPALGLEAGERQHIMGEIRGLVQRMEAAPKSLRWRLRSVIGERINWYDEPEEAARDAISLRLE
jgi:hypothetical protein